jgi:iron(III) transport system permease protein
MSLSNYKAVLDDHQVLGAVGHTIVMGVLASGVAVVLAAVAGWAVVRSRIPGRKLLDGLAFSPIVVPGLVLGVSLIFVYLKFPLPIYGTIWILVIAYATRLLPYGMRYSTSAMTRLSAELEEAGYSAGAGWSRVFVRIVLPLAKGGLSTAFVFGLLVCFREVSSVVLLYNASTETVPVYLWQQLTAGNLNIVAAGGTLLILLILALIGLGRLVGSRFGLEDGKRPFGMKEGE